MSVTQIDYILANKLKEQNITVIDTSTAVADEITVTVNDEIYYIIKIHADVFNIENNSSRKILVEDGSRYDVISFLSNI
ncbi:hypothetical protein [Methanohalobium sp.]|uniref:hypothetical protein n=1 Tax=Methanohalobium sp. TaxID=2837493 RepID=UPI0025E76F23|nr:hypothetical protein [Methanohalobium sp.]